VADAGETPNKREGKSAALRLAMTTIVSPSSFLNSPRSLTRKTRATFMPSASA
jgi:hypothetical protein